MIEMRYKTVREMHINTFYNNIIEKAQAKSELIIIKKNKLNYSSKFEN